MLGHLKEVSIVQQCVRCFSLRNFLTEGPECPRCKELLNETTTETQPLPLSGLSSDAAPLREDSVILDVMAKAARA